MWEVIELILIGCVGIFMGVIFGYVKGYDIGYKQGYNWAKKEEIAQKRYGG